MAKSQRICTMAELRWGQQEEDHLTLTKPKGAPLSHTSLYLIAHSKAVPADKTGIFEEVRRVPGENMETSHGSSLTTVKNPGREFKAQFAHIPKQCFRPSVSSFCIW